jgi:NADPH:quinone reductase-like Zn-dependent oxidoreductase
MKAAVCTRYGPPDVLEVREAGNPTPKDREVLVKIRATVVTSSDCFVRSGIPSAPLARRILFRLVVGIKRPRNPILGLVLAGDVEAAGKRVTQFHTGDRVYAFTKLRFGAYAEYIALSESATLAVAPSNLDYDEAAAIAYGGLLALNFLRKADVENRRVLIYGASGAVGSAAVQLAKHFGANVTAVCGPTNVDLVRSLGADEVLDYTERNTTPRGERYDVVFDAVGKKKTSALKIACRSSLAPGGRHISVDDGMRRIARNDLVLLTRLAETGAVKAVIDRRYLLDEIAAAHEYVERGHKKGNVVVSV